MADSASIAVAGTLGDFGSSTTAGSIVFTPVGSTYEFVLVGQAPASGRGRIRMKAKARKVLTVPAGGNFVTPIQGPPRVVQGRVISIEGNKVVVQAGVPVEVELPVEDTAVDLNDGAIAVGKKINATLLPGATFDVI